MEEAVIGALTAIILALLAFVRILAKRNNVQGSAEATLIPTLNEIVTALGQVNTQLAVQAQLLNTITQDCRNTNQCVNSIKTLLNQRRLE